MRCWNMSKSPPDQEKFLEEFKRGDTHAALAERYGVNRNTIRAWLKAADLDPSANVKKRRAAREEDLVGKLRQVQAQRGQRELVMTQLEALASKYKVKPLTLAHWYEGTGHYTPGRRLKSLADGRPRHLPRRRSGPGAALRAEVERACNPWQPRTVAGLLRERDRRLT